MSNGFWNIIIVSSFNEHIQFWIIAKILLRLVDKTLQWKLYMYMLIHSFTLWEINSSCIDFEIINSTNIHEPIYSALL